MGRYITQGLFLELGYNTEFAQFTLDDSDKNYEGVVYPSLKRLYIECADPVEYEFSKEHLLGWNHWKRLLDNKATRHHIDQWREELELSIRSEGVKAIIDLAAESNSFQAAKWLADNGWSKRKAGRPSTEDVMAETNKQVRIREEYLPDFALLKTHKDK